MKTILALVLVCLLMVSCDKRKEKGMRIAGTWDLTETVVTNYANNEPVGDSTVNQSGILIFNVSDGLDNSCVHTLDYAPMIETCYWDIPRKKMNQLFFYSYDESSFSVYSASCMIRKLTRSRLELVTITYDNDLNILQQSAWTFKRRKL